MALQAAFREDYSNDHVARSWSGWRRRPTSGTSCSASTRRSCRPSRDPKQAADLWVKIGRWYGRHLTTSTTPSRRSSRRCSSTPARRARWRRWTTSIRKQKRWRELVATLARHAECEEEPPQAGRDPAGDGRHRTRRSSATRRRRWTPTSRRWTPTSVHRRAQRARAALPAHAGVGRLIDVLPKKAQVVEDTEQVISSSLRSASCGRSGWATTTAPSRPTRSARGRSAEPAGAQGARAALREDRPHGGVPRRPRAAARGRRPEEERVSHLRAHGGGWEEQFRKPERACEALEKILLIDDRNAEGATATSSGCTARSASGTCGRDATAAHQRSTTDATERIELYAQMGQVYEEELHDLDRAIEAYNDILSFDADHVDALARRSRASTSRPSTGTAPSR